MVVCRVSAVGLFGRLLAVRHSRVMQVVLVRAYRHLSSTEQGLTRSRQPVGNHCHALPARRRLGAHADAFGKQCTLLKLFQPIAAMFSNTNRGAEYGKVHNL